ncbi:MAG: sodium:calcium antiporter [Candidatus Odinarchaeia archaeon]
MLIISLTVVIFSAEFVVNSALNITIGFWTSPLVIGAKIVSVGTSLSELTLDFQAVRHGHVHLAIGDILGSNLTNLTLVLGLTLILTSSHAGVCVVPVCQPAASSYWVRVVSGQPYCRPTARSPLERLAEFTYFLVDI